MMRPQHYINLVLLALVATGAVAALLWDVLLDTFLYNPWLNGVIGLVFLVGVVYAMLRIWRLKREIRWIEAFRSFAPGLSSVDSPRLLAPVATLLTEQERRGKNRLSTISVRYLLDSVQSRLDEQRDNARYLTGLLIFLGLLGTFWGLLQTITAVAAVIADLSLEGDMVATFGNLQDGLAQPLNGMGTAFSSSLFGLAGSLVLGFMDLQATRAQTNFFDDLEEWLSSLTQLSDISPTAPLALGDAADGRPMPAYVHALLARNAEATEALARQLADSEEARRRTTEDMGQLALLVDRLGQQVAAERSQLERFVASTQAIEALLGQQQSAGIALDAESRGHLAALHQGVDRLLAETAHGRSQSLEVLRQEIRLVTRTIAVAAGEPDLDPSEPGT